MSGFKYYWEVEKEKTKVVTIGLGYMEVINDLDRRRFQEMIRTGP